ncbi:hypothetical protein N8482_03530 [Chitinophagales bacterium]|nr:hypothetical protein [Chitinophagales bacterium]
MRKLNFLVGVLIFSVALPTTNSYCSVQSAEIDSLTQLIDLSPSPADKATHNFALAELLELEDSVRLSYYNAAFVEAKKTQTDSLVVAVLLGKYHFFYDKGEYIDCFKIAEQLQPFLAKNIHYSQEIEIHRSLAMPLHHFGDYEESQSHYFKGIELAKANGDWNQKYSLYTGLGRL